MSDSRGPVDSPSDAAARLRTAFDLWTTGVELQRQRFARLHPLASDEEIALMIGQWLQDRPGAEQGDGPQTPR